jgi:hypothetical protein
MVLSIIETSDFLTLLYKTTSDFGTVGLSLGLTPQSTTVSRMNKAIGDLYNTPWLYFLNSLTNFQLFFKFFSTKKKDFSK